MTNGARPVPAEAPVSRVAVASCWPATAAPWRGPHDAYPLQRRAVAWGLVAAFVAGLALESILAGLAVLTLFLTVGALWPREQLPILPFCLAYQWLFVVTGFIYRAVVGYYPQNTQPGDIDRAVLLSLLGFLVLTAGIRAGLRLAGVFGASGGAEAGAPAYDVRRVFWCVIGLYAIDWILEIVPSVLTFRAAQGLQNLLAFRDVFLVLLFLTVVRRGNGASYAAAALLVALLPRFTSMMSVFKELLFMLLIVLLAEWQPWSPLLAVRRRGARAMRAVVVGAAVLALMAMIWEGGVKPVWRPNVRAGLVGGSPIDKLASFGAVVADAAVELEPWYAFEAVSLRLSSGLGFFSNVLDHVPRIVPHQQGALVWRAIDHVLKPRILFPDKPNLGLDSWLVREYAGVNVAGEELQTSVGLGYMAEFYIDFGVPGLLVLVGMYGVLIGSLCVLVRRLAPSPTFASATVTVLLLGHFISYEGEIAKLLGGVLQAALIFGGLLWACGPWLHRALLPPAPRTAPHVRRRQRLVPAVAPGIAGGTMALRRRQHLD